jgi:hypothetical protein
MDAPASHPLRATVCVLQFLLDLSDRQAAEAVRCRIDFKYALAPELDDPGFHHSVLGDFRDRLAQGDRADRLLDLALARLKQAGLVRERGTQRTDSTHVLAAVRDLTRLELITEAVRAALEEIAAAALQLLAGLVDQQWGRRYGRPIRLGRNPTRPKTPPRRFRHPGRKRADDRAALEGILYTVVATGARTAAGRPARRRAAGPVRRAGGLQSSARAQRGDHTGPSPVDRRKLGSKHHLITDATGIPLAVTLTGGHRNDVTQLIPLLDAIPPHPWRGRPAVATSTLRIRRPRL